MRRYHEIVQQLDADNLHVEFAGFHDSFVKELLLLNRGFVGLDRSASTPDRADARVLIQSQWKHVAVELLAIDTRELAIKTSWDLDWSASITVISDRLTGMPRIHFRSDDCSFCCRRLFFRLRPDWHGPHARFGLEVPAPEQRQAIVLGDGWIQCPHCLDGFHTPTSAETCLCPSCSQLIDLPESAG
jgi:hypothetical protein